MNVVRAVIIGLLYSAAVFADPDARIPINYAQKDYMEWSEYDTPMQRDYRLLKEGMAVQFNKFKAYLNTVLYVRTPGYKRYKFDAYLHNDDTIVPVQYIDWTRVPPTLSNRSLDFYATGGMNLFCLEPQKDIPLYTFDGRFYKDTDGLLRSMANHLPIMGVDGYIYLETNTPFVDAKGQIFDNNERVGQLKIVSLESPDGMWTLDGTVFYAREPHRLVFTDSPDYTILQGYYEEGNEPPGNKSTTLIVPFTEGMAKSAKTYMDTYDLMFKAVSD